MPTNYGVYMSLELHIDCIFNINALLVDYDAVHCLVFGDFNCCPGSRFFNEFSNFATNNHLFMADLLQLYDVATYISDNGTKMSWIDHILCSVGISRITLDIAVLDDVVVSDRRPIYISFECDLVNPQCNFPQPYDKTEVIKMPLWSACDLITKVKYQCRVDELLTYVHVPFDTLMAKGYDTSFHSSIDKFYDSIIHCLLTASADVIPHRVANKCNFNVPGWNSYVSEKHDAARDAYRYWLSWGKPKCGASFDLVKKSRAIFKLALRYSKTM
jgi:hypothetical protein